MEKNIYILKKAFNCRIIFIILIVIGSPIVKAEGTKEFRPDSTEYGDMQINDMGRPFALESNTDPFHRLYIHISDYTHEKIYLGFNHVQSGSETATFRIVNPSGTVVYPTTSPYRKTIPSSGSGYIKWYSKAIAGPIIGFTGSGYTPISFTPQTNGDFYIEFTTSYQGTNTAYHFDLIDITVANGTTIIPGRLWSYCWDMSTLSYAAGYYGNMYVLTDDGYVSQVNFNGFEPYGFTISCNSTGPGNLPGGNNENRKSIAVDSTRPQYKIFLNNPDINAYPSGTIPSVIQNLTVVGTPTYGQPVLFTVNVSQAGIVQIELDINGIPGYQDSSSDVLLVVPIHAGLDTIIWDGKDGFGNYVTGGATVTLMSSFASGTTHLPIWDPETNPNGYIVNRVRPTTGLCDLFWDDSNFPGGTVNVDGSLLTGHSWPYNFGNNRTMNTWWNGYELSILNGFEFTIGYSLPVEFLNVTATADNNKVNVIWSTASETNNNYFTIERSADGISFIPLANVKGAGNSNTVISYEYVDNNPIKGVSYYKIKQTDYNGNFKYSKTVYVNFSLSGSVYSIYPNPVKQGTDLIIVTGNSTEENYLVSIFASNGEKISEYSSNGTSTIPIDNSLGKGIYYVKITSAGNLQTNKIVVE